MSDDGERFARGREEFGNQVEHSKEKVNQYRQYYRDNKGDIIDRLYGNIGEPKEPVIAGTVVVAPILVTLFAVDYILEKVNAIPYVDTLDFTNLFLVDQALKLVFVIVIGAITVTLAGKLVRTDIGFEVEKMIDAFMEKVPFLGAIYSITKVTTDTVLNGAEEFSDPVKIEFNGLRVTAYHTGNKTKDGREIVFVPTSPNITTGFVVEVEKDDIIDAEESPSEALTRTLSAGFGDRSSNDHKRSPVEEDEE